MFFKLPTETAFKSDFEHCFQKIQKLSSVESLSFCSLHVFLKYDICLPNNNFFYLQEK